MSNTMMLGADLDRNSEPVQASSMTKNDIVETSNKSTPATEDDLEAPDYEADIEQGLDGEDYGYESTNQTQITTSSGPSHQIKRRNSFLATLADQMMEEEEANDEPLSVCSSIASIQGDDSTEMNHRLSRDPIGNSSQQHPDHFSPTSPQENKNESTRSIGKADKAKRRNRRSISRGRTSKTHRLLNIRQRSVWFSCLIITLGIAASVSIVFVGIAGVNQDTRRTFDHDASQMVIAIQSAWDNYITLMLWAHESCHLTDRDLDTPLNVSVSKNLGFCSRKKFDHLQHHISSMGVDFVALQYCPNITNDAREAFEDEALTYYSQNNPKVAEDYVGIKAITLEEGKVTSIERSPPKPFYFPVHYMHPLDKNEKAVEIDLYSYRSEWVEKAFRTHAPVLSARAKLFQDPREEIWAVEMILPGLHDDAELHQQDYGEESADPSTRRLDHPPADETTPVTAVTKLVIRVVDLIEHAFRVTNVYQGMSAYMYDLSTAGDKPVFLAGVDVIEQDKIALHNETDLNEIHKHKLPSGSLFFEQTIVVADRQWLVVITPHDKDLYNGEFAFVILGGSIILAACLVLACWFRMHLVKTSRMNHLQAEAEKERAKHAENIALRETHLNDFLSHELRNPLSAALVALNFVSETTNEQVHAEHTRKALAEDLCILENSLQYMNDLLRNMLDIHRTNSKYIKIKNEPTHLLQDVLEPCKTIVNVRGSKASLVDIQVKSDPEDLVVNVDRIRLEQIVLNLAMNATRFVESGFILLRCGVTQNDNGEESTFVSVEDNGPGIPLEKRKTLFQKYQPSLNLVDQGTGIGLYICKHLSQLMEADIRLDEDYDIGARFVIDLQRPPMKEDSLGVLEKGPARDAKDETPSTSISSSVTTTLHDEEAPPLLTLPSSSSNLENRTLSFQDESDSSVSSSNRVLLLSKNASFEQGRNDPNQAQNAMDDRQEPRSSQAAIPASPLRSGDAEDLTLPESLRILFVDDDVTLRKLFVRSLRRLSKEWEISEAPNGETAIQKIVENEEHYDVIFMDQYMASTEKQLLGTETIQKLRLHGVDSLICGLSANDCESPFLRSGADTFLLKPLPFQQAALKKELHRILNCHGGPSRSSRHEDNAVNDDSGPFILIDGSHFQKPVKT